MKMAEKDSATPGLDLSKQDQAHLAILTYLQQLNQVSISAKLNSDHHKHCLQRLETSLKERRRPLLRSSLFYALYEMNTCHKMDLLNQFQLNHLCSQLQRHLALLKVVNPDYALIFNLFPSQPTDNEVEIIEQTSSASGSAPSSAPSMSAPLVSLDTSQASADKA
jgi:hypothetical protein